MNGNRVAGGAGRRLFRCHLIQMGWDGVWIHGCFYGCFKFGSQKGRTGVFVKRHGHLAVLLGLDDLDLKVLDGGPGTWQENGNKAGSSTPPQL